jgi:zinc transporter ZupT
MGPLGSLSESGLGVMLAIGAGSFLYVAASDLIPETHQGDIPRNVVAVLLGAVLMYLTVILLD